MSVSAHSGKSEIPEFSDGGKSDYKDSQGPGHVTEVREVKSDGPSEESLDSSASSQDSEASPIVPPLTPPHKSILLNAEPRMKPATNQDGKFTGFFNSAIPSIKRATKPNPAYQCGRRFMKDAPPLPSSQSSYHSSDTNFNRSPTVQFAPLPQGKPRSAGSFTLGVAARKDILKGVLPSPDARNPTSVTLGDQSRKVETQDTNRPAPPPEVYTYKDIAPAARKVVDAMRRRSSPKQGHDSKSSNSTSSKSSGATAKGSLKGEALSSNAIESCNGDMKQDEVKSSDAATEMVYSQGSAIADEEEDTEGHEVKRDESNLTSVHDHDHDADDDGDGDGQDLYIDAVDAHSEKDFARDEPTPRNSTFGEKPQS